MHQREFIHNHLRSTDTNSYHQPLGQSNSNASMDGMQNNGSQQSSVQTSVLVNPKMEPMSYNISNSSDDQMQSSVRTQL